MTPVLVVILSAVLVAALLLGLHRRRLARQLVRRSAAATSEVRLPDGEIKPLPEALWLLAAPGAADVVTDAIRACGSEDPQKIWATAAAAVDALPTRRADRYRENVARIQALDRERGVWDQQDELLAHGLQLGMIDAAVLGLAQADVWRGAVVGVAGSLAGHALSDLGLSAVMPDLMATVEASVGDATELAVGETIGVIADAHIPILTIVSAVRAAKSASDAGLDRDRVTESLVADIGLKGGGIMAGAALGTAVLPVVGTLIGGALGAFLGNGIAQEVRGRHLQAAQQQLWDEFERLGSGVGRQRWRSVTAHAAMGLTQQRQQAAALDEELMSVPTRSHDRTVVDLALLHLTAAAATDIATRQQTLDEWRAAVDEYGDADCATERGAILASSPELCRRLGLADGATGRSHALCSLVDHERKKLALA